MSEEESRNGYDIPIEVPSYEDYFETSENIPRLEDDAFYGILRDLVNLATEENEATREAVGLNILAAFAARYGRLAQLVIGPDRRRIRLYGLVVGLSSKGRKGVSAAFAHDLFERMDGYLLTFPGLMNCPALSAPNWAGTVTTGEGIIAMIRDESKEQDKKGKPLHPAVYDKRLLIEMSEFATVLTMAARQGNTASLVLRDAFDGRNIQTAGKLDPMFCTKPHICVMGSITPGELLARLEQVEIANGFMNRFMFGYSLRKKTVAEPPEIDAKLMDFFAQQLLARVAMLTDGHLFLVDSAPLITMKFDSEASPLWHELYEHFFDFVYANPACESLCSRIELHCWNIAAILAMMNGEKVICPACLRAAYAWVKFSRATIQFLFAGTNAIREAKAEYTLAQKILAGLEKRGGMKVPLHDILISIHKAPEFTKERFESALNALMNAAPPRIYIEVIKAPGVKPKRLLWSAKGYDDLQNGYLH